MITVHKQPTVFSAEALFLILNKYNNRYAANMFVMVISLYRQNFL